MNSLFDAPSSGAQDRTVKIHLETAFISASASEINELPPPH